MKRSVILMVIALMVAASMSAAAAEDIDFVGGITYNNFDLTATQDGDEVPLGEEAGMLEEVKTGMGFYFGGRYWIKENIALGLGYDKASSSYTGEGEILGETFDYTETITINGPYAEMVYAVNENVNFNAAVASYSLTDSYSIEDESFDMFRGNGIGFKVGGEYNYSINDQLAITGSAAYRIADLPVNEFVNLPDTPDLDNLDDIDYSDVSD
ncbi:MAG: hypothetical protein ACOCQH_01750, partial [Halanaerobiales bacterium]